MTRDIRKITARCALTAMACSAMLWQSCRHDVVVDYPTGEKPSGSKPDEVEQGEPIGFYLLDEGNMGMNKAAIDYYDYSTGEYTRDIYLQANPDAVMALGDVGNQIAINGDRLWAIINCSNKVEVMRSSDCRRVGQVDIPNCRHMAFDGDYAYVTSYAGPVLIDDNYNQLGYVAKINVNTLQEEARCIVRFQPDGIAVSGGRLYVANSGGYRPNNYEKMMSVIDIASFTVEKEVELGVNLNLVAADPEGKIWVSSRGDYYDVEPALYCYDPATSTVVKTFSTDATSMWMDGDLLYIVGCPFSYETMSAEPSFSVIDTSTLTMLQSGWEGAAEFDKIKVPYCVAVDPARGDIYITDAGNYVNPGYLYAFGADGSFKWRQRTGDIPASIAFLYAQPQ